MWEVTTAWDFYAKSRGVKDETQGPLGIPTEEERTALRKREEREQRHG